MGGWGRRGEEGRSTLACSGGGAGLVGAVTGERSPYATAQVGNTEGTCSKMRARVSFTLAGEVVNPPLQSPESLLVAMVEKL